MTNYNYLENIKVDVKEYIDNEINLKDFSDREELEEKLNDTLWTEDSVTGNASGSYYCNSWKAEEALAHNWDLLAEAMEEFSCEVDLLEKGAEWADVTIRCYLLGQAIGEVLDEMEEELEEAFTDDEE
ncbi:MAG: hypothetical protein SO206_06855 [Bacilli bacterium]|nr:hypothetical protein [Bacilli bacterium]